MSARLSARRLLAAVTTVWLAGVALAAPAAARASTQPLAAAVYDFGPGRAGASAGALLGLAGAVIGWLAVSRPAGRLGVARGPLGARTAVAAGLVALTLGVLVATTADAGIGTGNGRGGAYVAILVGLASTILGARAVSRVRRTS
ncbi:DUF6223 family protein [Streptomyces sp. NPDC093089]|uniref:DUF6223 family protein n=1 Tax=Streptomyces sp. NPDC093089 TaxID=3366024 RepID=UPI00381BEDD6